jgi:nucleoside-diphosphate kinase
MRRKPSWPVENNVCLAYIFFRCLFADKNKIQEIDVEQTLVILKPDCVQRRLMGRIIQRFEEKGLFIAAMKMIRISRELAEKHYAVHKDKPFYSSLIDYITSGPVVVMVVSGPNAIDVARKMMGKTFGSEAEPGTIRGDFGLSKTFNLIHGSDSPETAKSEIELYFLPEEILAYTPSDTIWLGKPEEQ